jgi:hypothetical protein
MSVNNCNCQYLPETKFASLSNILNMVKGLVSRGVLTEDQVPQVTANLTNTISNVFKSTNLTPADLPKLVTKYLPDAIQKANNQSNIAKLNTFKESSPRSQFGITNAVNVLMKTGLVSNTSNLNTVNQTNSQVVVNTIPSTKRISPSNNVDISSTAIPNIVKKSKLVSSDLEDYYNNQLSEGNDLFNILLWLEPDVNPLLQINAINNAKRLHSEIIVPITSYYKQQLYGDSNYPIRLGNILYGIVSSNTVKSTLKGSLISRHMIGEAVNFEIKGISNNTVVDDILNKRINVEYGTLAITTGIHITLPFHAANGQLVKNLYLHTNSNFPEFVDYQFN